MITKGLKDNKFLPQYTHLLTGYMGSVEFLEESAKLIAEMKQGKPELVYGESTKHMPSSFLLLSSLLSDELHKSINFRSTDLAQWRLTAPK